MDQLQLCLAMLDWVVRSKPAVLVGVVCGPTERLYSALNSQRPSDGEGVRAPAPSSRGRGCHTAARSLASIDPSNCPLEAAVRRRGVGSGTFSDGSGPTSVNPSHHSHILERQKC